MIRWLTALLLSLVALPAMAAITYIAVETKDQGTNSSSVVIDITNMRDVVGILDDDVMVAFVAKDDAPLDSPGDGSWVEIFNDSQAGQNHAFGCWYRIVTDAASEPDNYSFSNDSEERVGAIVLLRGVDLTQVEDVGFSLTKNTNTDEPVAGTVTTSKDGVLVFRALGIDRHDTPVAPVGPTNIVNLASSSSSGRSFLSVSYEIQASQGASGTETWTGVGTAAESMSTTVAIRVDTGAPPAGRTRRMF